jgi:hypothetical protein
MLDLKVKRFILDDINGIGGPYILFDHIGIKLFITDNIGRDYAISLHDLYSNNHYH